MTAVLFLDVPENQPIVDVARQIEFVRVGRRGPYFEVTSDAPFAIDRRATGSRHAVWYSCIAGLSGFRVDGWDKDSLRLALLA